MEGRTPAAGARGAVEGSVILGLMLFVKATAMSTRIKALEEQAQAQSQQLQSKLDAQAAENVSFPYLSLSLLLPLLPENRQSSDFPPAASLAIAARRCRGQRGSSRKQDRGTRKATRRGADGPAGLCVCLSGLIAFSYQSTQPTEDAASFAAHEAERLQRMLEGGQDAWDAMEGSMLDGGGGTQHGNQSAALQLQLDDTVAKLNKEKVSLASGV